MKQIISASRRTDIPAYYLKWFMERLQEGYVEVTNPFYRKQVKHVSLRPDDVEWIVFWSRNYGPFLKNYSRFKDYNLFFHFTILPKSPLEKSGLAVPKLLGQLEQLAELYGSEHIIWRYDPLVYWQDSAGLHTNHNPSDFDYLCRAVAACGVKRCYFSFAYPYGKLNSRFSKKFGNGRLIRKSATEQQAITRELKAIADSYAITLYSCCNDSLLSVSGIQKGHCIDGVLLNTLPGKKNVSEAKAPTRKDCGCTRSIDIGDYIKQPCPTGCLYCYANPIWK